MRFSRARHLFVVLLAASLLAAACSDSDTDSSVDAEPSAEADASPDSAPTSVAAPAEPVSITLVSHDSFAVSDEVLASFTASTGIEVELLAADDAGEALNQSILSAGNPLGDVFFGVDNTFLSRALEAEIFLPYEAPALDDIPDEFELDPEFRLLPVDYGDVCLNYDVAWFTDADLPVPIDLIDLTADSYAGLLVGQNPATSSPGLAFLLATIAEFGEDGDYTWQDYWTDLRSNDITIQSGWSEAYYGDFTVGGGGDRPMVVSYASSPPAEVIFADPPVDEAPTWVIENSCFRQIEFVGVLAGTSHEDEARQLVDFLLSTELQEDIPLNMFVFPVNETATLPPEFIEHTVVPEQSLTLDPATIAANRDRWIEEWTELVLR